MHPSFKPQPPGCHAYPCLVDTPTWELLSSCLPRTSFVWPEILLPSIPRSLNHESIRRQFTELWAYRPDSALDYNQHFPRDNPASKNGALPLILPLLVLEICHRLKRSRLLHCEAAINQCCQRKALMQLPFSVLVYYLSPSLLILLQFLGADTTATFPFRLDEDRHAQGMGRKARMRYSWALRGSCCYTRDCAICLHEAAYCNLLACQTEGLDTEDVQIVEWRLPLEQ
ncbi:hypothetical protein BDV09DRAFT_56644 [Aspergillus tetrazonus]